MKFSILVPVYNVEQYLEQCVESLLNQTYSGEYEIILVDDGSTDSSGKMCDKYAENNPDKIKVIHKENGGLVSARQAGIEVATGEYSLFVDSDDFVELNLLETIYELTNKYSKISLINFAMNYFDGTNKIPKKNCFCSKETLFKNENKKDVYEALISTSYVTSLCLKAVKTDILKNDPTDFSLYYDKNMAEDWFRSIYLLTASDKIVYINTPLYNYRTNNASISRSFRPETITKKNTLYVYDRFMEYLPKWGLNDEEHILKLNAHWLNSTMYTFKQYYENSTDKRAVLNYDWSSMLPTKLNIHKHNPYVNKVYEKLYFCLTKKKFVFLRIYFIKEKIRKFIKKISK